MDQGLFGKYVKQIERVHKEKEELCSFIESVTSISLSENEITLVNKKVTITTSSVKKSFLERSSLKEALLQKGYSLQQ